MLTSHELHFIGFMIRQILRDQLQDMCEEYCIPCRWWEPNEEPEVLQLRINNIKTLARALLSTLPMGPSDDLQTIRSLLRRARRACTRFDFEMCGCRQCLFHAKLLQFDRV